MFSHKSYVGLGRVPVGRGAILRGWDVTEKDFFTKLPVVDFRAMPPGCPNDCFHCFTDKQKHTLSFANIKDIIDQIAEMGARGIDYLGEGEPTIAPNYFEIIEYTSSKGIIPAVFTEAAKKMRDRNFVKRTKDAGASVCPKCDSLFNAEYQNWVVGDKTGKFFHERNEALLMLMEEGFNEIDYENGTTRLGFDMVISTRNIDEVENTLRFCREKNIWIVFSSYLPTGRSGCENFDHSLCPGEEKMRAMRQLIQNIDHEYGFDHRMWNNFATIPCVERLQIYGDGRVSPCPGNETPVGNILTQSLREIHANMLEQFPGHNPASFDGNCLYRASL